MQNLQHHHTPLRTLWDRLHRPFGTYYENCLHKFYTGSFKVFHYQRETLRIVEALEAIAPEGRGFCPMFKEIIRLGTGHEFTTADNEHWIERAAPIVQAFLHARFFLQMALKHTPAPPVLHAGWMALLSLYEL